MISVTEISLLPSVSQAVSLLSALQKSVFIEQLSPHRGKPAFFAAENCGP